jgi:hypothetical protein
MTNAALLASNTVSGHGRSVSDDKNPNDFKDAKDLSKEIPGEGPAEAQAPGEGPPPPLPRPPPFVFIPKVTLTSP